MQWGGSVVVTQNDSEVEAIGLVTAALAPLEPDQATRVLRWATERFGVAMSEDPAMQDPAEAGDQEDGKPEFPDFGSLYHRADPSTDAERALVGGYWVQNVRDTNPFTSYEVNKELKNLGFPVVNIARAFSTLLDGSPRLAMQVSKSSKAKQARKTYRLTDAGLREAERMLSAQAAD